MAWLERSLAFEVTVDISLFDSFALVVFFLTFAGSDDELNVATAGEETDGDELEAVLFGAGELANLFASGEEFNVALGVGAEGEVVKPELVAANCDERTFELNVVIANEANFGAAKEHATAQLITELIIKAGTAIDGNAIWGFGLLHRYNYSI